ncbi:MAG: hypothetical protein K8F91_21110, partial [Candidatus Obscuribacterales bacterium]|nr:hypothetical protein [Candidatus Obscuribacterales bacterium]
IIRLAVFCSFAALLAGIVSPCALAAQKRNARVTVGTIEVRDWQSRIVDNYPNLKHYHWNPIYSNVQAIRPVSPPRPPKLQGRSKPARTPHRRTIDRKYMTVRPAARERHFYKKPIHTEIAPNRQKSETSASLNQEKIQAQLKAKRTEAGLRAKQTQADLIAKHTQARLNQDRQRSPQELVAANLDNKQVSACLTSQEVEARLSEPLSMQDSAPKLLTYENDYTSTLNRSNATSRTTVHSSVKGRIGH